VNGPRPNNPTVEFEVQVQPFAKIFRPSDGSHRLIRAGEVLGIRRVICKRDRVYFAQLSPK